MKSLIELKQKILILQGFLAGREMKIEIENKNLAIKFKQKRTLFKVITKQEKKICNKFFTSDV